MPCRESGSFFTPDPIALKDPTPDAAKSAPEAITSAAVGSADNGKTARSINVEGDQLSLQKEIKNGHRYTCAWRKSQKGCTFAAKVMNDGRVFKSGEHQPGCHRKNGKRTEKQVGVDPTDCRDDMHQFVSERCMHPDHLHETSNRIWADTVDHFRESHGETFQGMSKKQVLSLVNNTRQNSLGGNAVSKAEAQYSGTNNTAFLRHSSTFTDENRIQRMMCFSLPQLLCLLAYPLVS